MKRHFLKALTAILKKQCLEFYVATLNSAHSPDLMNYPGFLFGTNNISYIFHLFKTFSLTKVQDAMCKQQLFA